MATTKGRNYSILVGIKLDTSDVQKQLDKIKLNDININVKVNGKDELKETNEILKETNKENKKASKAAKEHADEVEKLGLTYQQANAIMSKSVEIIGMMVDSVFELDDALTSFKKVSDLSGQSLDSYVEKLTQMGLEVGRTGKPQGQSRGVQMVNVRRELFKIQ